MASPYQYNCEFDRVDEEHEDSGYDEEDYSEDSPNYYADCSENRSESGTSQQSSNCDENDYLSAIIRDDTFIAAGPPNTATALGDSLGDLQWPFSIPRNDGAEHPAEAAAVHNGLLPPILGSNSQMCHSPIAMPCSPFCPSASPQHSHEYNGRATGRRECGSFKSPKKSFKSKRNDPRGAYLDAGYPRSHRVDRRYSITHRYPSRFGTMLSPPYEKNPDIVIHDDGEMAPWKEIICQVNGGQIGYAPTIKQHPKVVRVARNRDLLLLQPYTPDFLATVGPNERKMVWDPYLSQQMYENEDDWQGTGAGGYVDSSVGAFFEVSCALMFAKTMARSTHAQMPLLQDPFAIASTQLKK